MQAHKILQNTNLLYLIYSLLNLAKTNIEVHLLLLQFTAFLIEQVGILVDEVQVVARSDGHGVTTSLCQTVVSLYQVNRNTYEVRIIKIVEICEIKQVSRKPVTLPGEVSGAQRHSR